MKLLYLVCILAIGSLAHSQHNDPVELQSTTTAELSASHILYANLKDSADKKEFGELEALFDKNRELFKSQAFDFCQQAAENSDELLAFLTKRHADLMLTIEQWVIIDAKSQGMVQYYHPQGIFIRLQRLANEKEAEQREREEESKKIAHSKNAITRNAHVTSQKKSMFNNIASALKNRKESILGTALMMIAGYTAWKKYYKKPDSQEKLK